MGALLPNLPRIKSAARRGRQWLSGSPVSSEQGERHLELLFAMIAADSIAGETKATKDELRRLAALLPRAEVMESCMGLDPVLVLAVYRMLRDRGIGCTSLEGLAAVYAAAVRKSARPLEQELVLSCALLQDCGFEVPQPAATNVICTAGPDLVPAPREEVLEICRWIMVSTACGRCAVDFRDSRLVLPQLSVSYARSWDIGAVCAIIRVCAYLGLAGTPACHWASEWVLDQQQFEGWFGVFRPGEAMDQLAPETWQRRFAATTDALWCLAELCRPSFMLAPAPLK
jgi:hypothetical protein